MTATVSTREIFSGAIVDGGKVSLKKIEVISFDKNSVQVRSLKFEAALELTKNFKQVSHR